MKVSFFIDRPVFSAVISIVIVIVGIIGLTMLPVDQYPQITPPVVKISASYPGASALTVSQAVATPIEQEINGTPGMLYMESNSSNSGGFSATVTFDVSADPDLAAVEIQNRVKLAESRLPAEVIQNGISVEKQAPSQLMTICLTSSDPKFDEIYLSNFATINVLDLLRRIPGVGRVSNIGSRYYAMQIWALPDKLANFGLTVQDLQNALKDQNRESAAGVLGQQPVKGLDITIPITTQGRLSSAKQFEDIVVRANANGSIIRLRDVARVSLEASSYSTESGINGENAAVLGIYMLPGANAMEVAKSVKAAMEEISANFPEGMSYEIPFDMTTYISESIHEVYKTLFEALILVVLVVFLSLQSWRATVIPIVAVPISLIGTFGFMLIFGFSLNILTLLGLILAIGIVVDDAIVVVEAVQSKFDAGYKSAYLATKDAMGDVTMAIVSCTCVFMAVFIPVTFMGGTSGVFYTQFGITMATAVGISMISALTLCPALCAIMMRPSDGTKSAKSINGRVRAAYNASFNAVLGKYKRGVMFFIRHRWMVWTSLAVAVALLVYLMSTTKTGLVPQEDQGVIMVNVSISPGSTLEETTKVMDRLENILKDTPEIEHYARVAGYGLISGQGTSYGTIIIRLKDWSERKGKEHSSDAVVSRLNGQFQAIKEAQVFSFQPAMIPGYGMGNSLELNLQDMTGGELATFYEAAIQFLGALNERPEVAMAYTSYAINFPQISVEVDAAKCKRAGISPSAVLDAVGSYCGGAYISNYNQYGKVYRVMMQASPEYRLDEQALNNMFVRNGTQMAPVSQFVTLKQVLGPETANRFNLYSTITANVNPADGYSSGEVQKVIEEVAAQSLPAGYGYEYGGMAREEASSGGAQTVFIYAICIFLVYLILACLYESFLIPFAVIFSVPFGLMGSFLFAKILGLENNIYLQTGVIMLIGLLAKTAILITEYAIERRRKGMGIVESAYSAAQVRLRPILMTVLTMIFGMLPLMFSSGAGANGNSSLGTGVVGGMAVGTLALLFVVPVFYIIFEFLQEKIRKPMEEEPDVQVLLEKEKSEVERERK